MIELRSVDSIEPDEGSWLYFIQSIERGPVKIGRAKDPRDRLAALQTANPEQLVLIAALRGGGGLEKTVHRILADFRVSGEWFEEEAVESLLESWGVPFEVLHYVQEAQ